MKLQNKLSAVIITFNEEKNIARCLDSLQGVADEIIVVDSFSTDQTKEICQAHKVTFIQHPFEGHIQQKNFAMQQAKYAYVLSLDADECLTEQLKAAILKAKQHFDYDAYTFNRLNNYCGQWIKHCGWYPDKKVRIWNQHKGKWGGENPHDIVVLNPQTTVKHLQGDLLHYSFSDIWQHLKQIHFFTDISAKAAVAKGKKANTLDIVIKPFVKFCRDYFWHLGFLDGYYGFIICINSAYAKFLKYLKMKELSK